MRRANKLTEYGVFLLRIVSGLFFFIAGTVNLLQPQDFLILVERLPHYFNAVDMFIHPIVTSIELIGGLLLLIGWNARLATLPLALITIFIGVLVLYVDEQSKLQILSLIAHIAAIGIYASLLFLGGGAWSLDKGEDVFFKMSRVDGNFIQRLSHDIVTDRGKNFGVGLLRLSISLFFLMTALLIISKNEYNDLLPNNQWAVATLTTICILGSISILSGFKLRFMGWVLSILTIMHFIFIGYEQAWISQIGLINVLFHGLLLAAILSLRIIRFGSDQEAEHILSLDKKTIIVIGGGFAGTSLVKKLERKIPDDWQVVMISEENYTTFNPMLAEIVGGTVMPSHVIAPIRRMVHRTRFIAGQVTSVDFKNKALQFEGEEKISTLSYEHLVFALGSRANADFIPGMPEHSLPFKLLGDALALRNRVIERMEAAEQEEDVQIRQWLGHFIVIGGGFSGIEVAGAIQDFIQSSAKHYPRLTEEDLKVSVVHGTDLPLPELGGGTLGIHTRDSMRARGISMLLEKRVTGADDRGVTMGTNERVDGGTIICTIGTKPNPLIGTLEHIELDRGRIAVNPDMSAQGVDNVWAIGDCAFVPNALDGKPAPPTAQFAMREGQQLADNINCNIRGGSTRPFIYKSKGAMATIGHLNGVADLGFMKVKGFSGWLLWRAFYLSLMPTIPKKTKIFFEWTWSMLFSADIINLRFTTSSVADIRKKDRQRY